MPDVLLQLVVWHFGQLHAYEKLGVFGLAILPFVVLGLLQWLRGPHSSDEAPDRASTASRIDAGEDHSPAR